MKGAPPRRTATGEAVVIIMIKAVIIGFAHMHVNEVTEYILGQPETLLRGIADVAPTHPEICEKRYTRDWNRRNVEALSLIHIFISAHLKRVDASQRRIHLITSLHFIRVSTVQLDFRKVSDRI